METKIIVYIRRGTNRIVRATLEAGIAGLDAVGEDYQVLYEDEYRPSEIAALYGFHKRMSKVGSFRKEMYDTQNSLGHKVLTFERGFINRSIYHSVGWNGINGRADFVVKNCPKDRFEKLDVDVRDWKVKGKNILICGQVPWDSNVQHLNTGYKKRPASVQGYMDWLSNTIKTVSENTHRKLVFRPHPSFRRRKEWYEVATPKWLEWSQNSLAMDLKRAKAVVVFNSNTAVEAAIQGIPVFACDIGSMAYPIANTDLTKINDPITPDRTQWLYDLAYKQWTLEELSQGLFWEHLNGTS